MEEEEVVVVEEDPFVLHDEQQNIMNEGKYVQQSLYGLEKASTSKSF